MPFEALVVRVLIASPGDAAPERNSVERAVHSWNAARAQRSGVLLLPVRWESSSVPVLGADVQSIINSQIVDTADIVMAFFDARLGSVTPRGLSGTAEEIERSAAAGKPVHVWFSDEALPRDVDLEQIQRLREFQVDLQTRGLLGTYADPEDLAFQVRQALEQDVERWSQRDNGQGAPRIGRPRLRARGVQRASAFEVAVSNSGMAPAENLVVRVRNDRGTELQAHGHNDGVTLYEGASLTWQLWLSLGSGTPSVVHMEWIEAGQPQQMDQPI